MENISREDKSKEAVRRMKILKIYPETIRQFERDGKVSESVPPVGACYWISGTQLDRVRAFEEKYNALVYHVIHAKYEFRDGDIMEMENYLYVSDYSEEWEMETAGLQNNEACAYVYNDTAPDLSESGYIGIALTPAGGLRRTW